MSYGYASGDFGWMSINTDERNAGAVMEEWKESLGADVEIRVAVTAIDGRKVCIEAEVREGTLVIGRGTHTRFVIDVQRFRQRLEKRAREPASGS